MEQTPPTTQPAPPSTVPVGAAPPGFALSPQQLREISLAQKRATKIRRAIRVAKTDAVIMSIFAVVCVASGLFGEWVGLALGLGLGWVTFISFRGAAGLAKYDLAAPRMLAVNQLVLTAMVCLYAAWTLYAALHDKDLASTYSQLHELLPDFDADKLMRNIYMAIYLSLIGATVIVQPLMALYYLSRKRHIQDYLDQTPPWIVELQKRRVI